MLQEYRIRRRTAYELEGQRTRVLRRTSDAIDRTNRSRISTEMNAMELMQEVGLRHSLAQPSTQSCFLEIKDIVTLDTDNEFYRRLVLYGSVDHHDLAGERLKVARTYCGDSCRGELERIRRRLDGWLIWRFEWESELAGLLMHDRLLYRREREESIDAHLLVDGFLVFVARYRSRRFSAQTLFMNTNAPLDLLAGAITRRRRIRVRIFASISYHPVMKLGAQVRVS